MKKIKQVIITFEDGSFKGYSWSGFLNSLKAHLEEYTGISKK